jgi:hypothetical protein
LEINSSFVLSSKPKIFTLECKFGFTVVFFDLLLVPVFEFFDSLSDVFLPPSVESRLYPVLKKLFLLTDFVPVVEGSIVLDVFCSFDGFFRGVEMRLSDFLN